MVDAERFICFQTGFPLALKDAIGSHATTADYGTVTLSQISSLIINYLNYKITETHVGGAITFALKTADGNDPSITTPVYIYMPDKSLLTITAALSLTVSSGSTLGVGGTGASNPFRLWLAIASNSGVAALVIRNCTNAAGILGFDPRGILSSTAEGGAGGADTIRTNYSTSALTNVLYAYLAFVDYESGLPTAAGTWDASPTRIINYIPGTRKPGDVVQDVYSSTTSSFSTTSGTFVDTPLTLTYVPASPINILDCSWMGGIQVAAGANGGRLRLTIGGAAVGAELQLYAGDLLSQISLSNPRFLYWPLGSANLTITLQMRSGGTGGTVQFLSLGGSSAFMDFKELMA